MSDLRCQPQTHRHGVVSPKLLTARLQGQDVFPKLELLVLMFLSRDQSVLDLWDPIGPQPSLAKTLSMHRAPASIRTRLGNMPLTCHLSCRFAPIFYGFIWPLTMSLKH
jgi:hypothetical protein